MKTLLSRLKYRLFEHTERAENAPHVDYQLNATGNAISAIKRVPKPANAVLDHTPAKTLDIEKKWQKKGTFKPYAYLNRYGQIVRKRPSSSEAQHNKPDNRNESALRQLIKHCMVCNGLLSQNYQIELESQDHHHAVYNVTIRVPTEFAFSEQRRILVEEIIYATVTENLAADVTSIVWLNT